MIIPQCLPIMPNESMASYVYRLCKANGLSLEIFTGIYMGKGRTFAQLDAGLFNAKLFCSCLHVHIRPDVLLKNHTYNEIIKMFYDPESHNGSWVYEEYRDGTVNIGLHIVKCPRCIDEDIKAGRPGYIHIEHCFPGANRCMKHNTPLFWYTDIETNKSEHYTNKNIGYTHNNRDYLRFCAYIQKRGAFADRTTLYSGLVAAIRMLNADELYINQAVINEEYTHTDLWDTRTGYRGYNNKETPSFNLVNSIPEILSTLLFLFRTPENVVSYYSMAKFATHENKVALFLRLLTRDKYILKDIIAVTDDDIEFTAIHTVCTHQRPFSLNRFTLGERCPCEGMDDSAFLEYVNHKADGFYEIKRSKSVPGRFSCCYGQVTYPFNYTLRNRNSYDALPKEFVLQEINRPTLSPSFRILYTDRLYKETFAFIREKRNTVFKHIDRLKPGDAFTKADVLSWAGFKQNMEVFVLNGINRMVNDLLDSAYELYRELPGVNGNYVRI